MQNERLPEPGALNQYHISRRTLLLIGNRMLKHFALPLCCNFKRALRTGDVTLIPVWRNGAPFYRH